LEPSQMFIAMNRFKVIKEERKAFEDLWVARQSHLDEVKGFRAFHLLRGPVFSLESGRVLLRHARPRYAAAPWPTIAPPRTPLIHNGLFRCINQVRNRVLKGAIQSSTSRTGIRLRAATPRSTATARRVEDGRWRSLAKANSGCRIHPCRRICQRAMCAAPYLGSGCATR
jgi:hypothetical protein